MRLTSDCLACNTLQPSFVWQKTQWDTLASLKEVFRRKQEEGLLDALPFVQEWLQSWGCRTWPQLTWAVLPPHCRCLCPAMHPTDPDPDWLPSLTQELPHPCDLTWWPLYPGWPSDCLYGALSRSHWLVFWASPQPCVITTNLSDLFTEPGVNSVLLWTLSPSPDTPCLDPEGWGPGWWVSHAARLVSMLCPDSLALMASHPLLGLTVMLELGVQTGYSQNKGLAPC